MEIAALIISICAALFTGFMVLLSYREQQSRLRPQVYIDKIDTHISSDVLTFRIAIQNVGLLPAKNVTISPILKANGITKELTDEDVRSKVTILPNQICWNTMQITGETGENVLQGSVKLSAEISIDYESNGKKYYYKASYEFNIVQKSWTILDGDAN